MFFVLVKIEIVKLSSFPHSIAKRLIIKLDKTRFQNFIQFLLLYTVIYGVRNKAFNAVNYNFQ